LRANCLGEGTVASLRTLLHRGFAIPNLLASYTNGIKLSGEVRVESLLWRVPTCSDVPNSGLLVGYQISADGKEEDDWSFPVVLFTIAVGDIGDLSRWNVFDAIPDFKAPYVRFAVGGTATNAADTVMDLAIYVRAD